MHPDFLYHYTSIANLARILHTSSLRFNRLDRIDDLQEAMSSDLGNLGRLFFVSCWSNSAEESIPLWQMYTPNMAGVRIKLAARMFRKYIIEPQSDGFIEILEPIEIPMPYDRFMTDQYLVNPMIFKTDMFLREMEYTDDQAKLFPTLRKIEGEHIEINFGKFGVCKRTEWRFQNEWRYILMFLPLSSVYRSLPASERLHRMNQDLLSGIDSGRLPFEDFYLDLEKSVLDNMEVMLGPRCSEGDEIIVESLLSKYCRNPAISHSSLKGFIR